MYLSLIEKPLGVMVLNKLKIPAKVELIVAPLLTAFGAYLRLRNLVSREFWYDEAFSGILARESWSSMLHLAFRDTHPPLYYVALKEWTELFGVTDFAMRSLSVVFGVALIPLVYLFSKKVSGNMLTPYLATFVTAISPFLIDYSQETRSYTMLAFLTILSGYFLHEALTKSPMKFNIDWLIFSILLPIAFLTHYIFAFGIISMALISFGYLKHAKLLRKENILGIITLLMKVSVVPLVAFGLWFPTLKSQLELNTALSWVPEAQFSLIPRSLYAFLFGVNRQALGVPPVYELSPFLSSDTVSFVTYTLFVVLGTYTFGRSISKLSLTYPLLMGLLPITGVLIASIYFGKHLYVERFLIGYGVFLIVYIANLISEIKSKSVVAITVVTYLLLTMLMPDNTGNPGYRELSIFIRKSSGTVVFVDPIEFVTAKYYLGKELNKEIKLLDPQHNIKFEGWVVIDGNDVLNRFPEEPCTIVSYKPLNRAVSYKIGEFRVYESCGLGPM